MHRTFLYAKLHRVTCTHVNLNYEGSCAIDETLLIAADIQEYQQIDIYNINNGERFTTYAIKAKAGSKVISLNGSAARKAVVGDKLIIATYASFSAEALKDFQPKLIYVDENNQIVSTQNKIFPQDYA